MIKYNKKQKRRWDYPPSLLCELGLVAAVTRSIFKTEGISCTTTRLFFGGGLRNFLVDARRLEGLLEVLIALGLLTVVDSPEGVRELLDKLLVDLGDRGRGQDTLRRNDQAPLVATTVCAEENDVT